MTSGPPVSFSFSGSETSLLPQYPDPVAIIGIGCRFPGGARSPEGFWKNLASGLDAISDMPADRWNQKAFYDRDPDKPGKSHACRGGFIEGIDCFDPQFFGISPREAARMDPQQRMLLEVAWEALEDGGQVLPRISGTNVAVFVGISSWDYSVLQTSFRDRSFIDAYVNTGGSLSIAANRISYCFDFRGPSSAVDTACSSALVAVHLACQSIWTGGATLALAGGVNALLAPDWYVGFSRMGMLSPDGRCKAFDARGNGFVRSEGAGIVVLKPLSRALEDGDRIYAAIRGTAVNQDGRSEGMTVPSREAQMELLRQACRNAGVRPGEIQYVEAHGTGTPVGDPIEASAIGTIVGLEHREDSPCTLGSVKTNIGHLEAGSGIAGLIKTALALHHKQIPGNLHFEAPNPEIDFQRLHLRVPTSLEPWPDCKSLPLAGVNSFGFGGTNAHAVLQGAPTSEQQEESAGKGPIIVPLSARSPEAVKAAAIELRESLSSEVSLHDLGVNLAERRTHHSHRLAVLAGTKEELAESLGLFLEGKPTANVVQGRPLSGQKPRFAFVCSGQGPQWWGMGRKLLREERVFRDAIEHCDSIVRALGSWSLLAELGADESRSRMDETAISQPSIFAIQVALAALWKSWGVSPEAVIGHSVGEVAAAYLAGVFNLEDAVRVIYHRGRTMDRASSHGRMLAVGMPAVECQPLIATYKHSVSIAAINSPGSTTLSGESGALEEIARVLEGRNVFARFLKVSYAFHSPQMEPVRDELLESLKGIRPGAAKLPFFSTVTGERVAGPELGPEYWWRNVRKTVQFARGVEHLVAGGFETILELSPHPVLCAAVAECYQHRGKTVSALPSLRRNEDERATLLHSAAELHVHGHELDWRRVTPGPRRFVNLPSYRWQRQRYWSESEESWSTRLFAPVHPLLGRSIGGPHPAWEARLGLREMPYLAAHRVQGVAILPATAYIECSLAAAREISSSDSIQIENLKLSSPCFPPEEGARWLHVAFCRGDSILRIDSRPTGPGQDDWVTHFQAAISRQTPPDSCEQVDLEAVRARCPKVFPKLRFYSYLASLGLDYGPAFQGIERVWQGEREALGEVVLPEDAGSSEDYLLHPALLDSCFHVVIAADSDCDHVLGDLYLPIEIERVRLYRPAGKHLWSRARLRDKTSRLSTADIWIYDDEARLVAEIRGLRSQRVSSARRESLEDMLYAYRWIEKPLPDRQTEEHGPGQWLIFADNSGLGGRLARLLEEGGDEALTVVPGPYFAALAKNRWQIDPASRNDMARLLESTSDLHQHCRGIVFLWALDAASSKDLTLAGLDWVRDQLLPGITHLAQQWQKGPASTDAGAARTGLSVVTRGAQSTGDRPEPTQVAQSPLIGFGRVVINELVVLQGKLIDLDPVQDESDASWLLKELLAGDDEDEVALRGNRRFVHRFQPSTGEGPSTPSDSSSEPYRLVAARPGTIDGLTLKAFQRTPPGPGEVEIEVRAAGLNFSDVMKALGLYPGLPEGPVSFGAECSGTVVAVGERVKGLAVGDEVLAVAPFAFASHVTTREEFVARKPAHLSFEAAATIPIAFLTASYALRRLAHIETGERVLIHSATGGVGLAAIQIARNAGAEIFATAGTDEKRCYLSEMGIQHVMDSRSLIFADEVLEATEGRGVDIVLNSLAGEAIAKGIASLTEYGRFLEIGKRDIYQNTRIGLLPFHKNLSFFAIDLDRVMRERPAFLGKTLADVVSQVQQGMLAALPQQVFPASEIGAAFRFMQQGKHIGKVVVSMRERPASIAPGDEAIRFKADASYLITGGFGGFGFATAKWLAQRGAKHLILASRRGENSLEAYDAIAELKRLGVRVLAARADVTSQGDLMRLLAEIADGMPPLRGIVHAAMVLEDSLLQNLDADRLGRVLAPKLHGAWNLHSQTQQLALDFFVLFSSLSSVFGHAGQANYAAANAFLDSLAWYRRSRGLPCLTVNWGHLGEVGYLAERPELSERLSRQGILPFTVTEAMSLLERAMQRRSVQVSVMRVDWRRWKGLGVTGRVSPRFAELLQTASASGDEGTPASIRARVQATPARSRLGLLGPILREKLARVLGTSLTETDWETPLLQLGIDSLMAVEMVNWVQAELGISLPVVELMRSPGVSSLTGLLVDRFTGTQEPDPENELEAAPDEAIFPLSFGQRALGFLHQMDSTSPALNLSFCSRVLSPIDPDAFRRAFQTLIDRHPALRTTFVERNGELWQCVHPQSEAALDFVDASSWSEPELRSRVEQDVARPFDLERGPLLRMCLFTRSNCDHVFLFTAHHIIGDFWSLIVLLEEMRIIYPAALQGISSSLQLPASDYRQFVRWQSERLAGAEGEKLRTWWINHLEGVPHFLDLPSDRPRPAHFTHRGGAVPCRLDAALTTRLKELATDEQATLFVVLLAGFQAFLNRYCGQDDFVVGSPYAGRPRREFEGVVGYFINMLPLRARLADDPSFRQLVQRVRGTVFEAFEYQDYPFSLIVERVGIERDLSRTPLIQASFTLETAHRRGESGASRFLLPQTGLRMEIGGLETEPFAVEQRVCQADLEVVLEENDGTVEGMLCYNTDLFEKETACHIAELYRDLLAALVSSPETAISRSEWLSREEKHRVLEGWNQTSRPADSRACLLRIFEKQVAASPQAIAVRQGGLALGYRELDNLAGNIGRVLLAQGLAPGQLVILALGRSPEMIAAMLGVWKAGGAFLPLDPETPRERVAHVLQETCASLLVSHLHDREHFSSFEVDVLCPESLTGTEEHEFAPAETQPGDLAYVVYTSGSTGKPKGVMVEQEALANTIHWRLRQLPTRPRDRVLLSLPCHFDAAFTVIFPTLLSGAELVLASPGEERDPARLLERIAKQGVTGVQCLPSTLGFLLGEAGFDAAFQSVTRVCCGGEAMPAQLPQRLFSRHQCELINLYGPTEIAVEATWHRCGAEAGVVPIGKPIDDVRVYVLDEHRQPVPSGVPGELFVAGAGLARGYLGDEALTAARFHRDPFSLDQLFRMFQTGDRVRWRADGTLEFLGRLDRQVKISGHRIEPGEIEDALRRHSRVSDAAVVPVADSTGNYKLVAYFVTRGAEETPSNLRQHLQQQLPAYMIPSEFVPIAEIPRSASGKINVRALPNFTVRKQEHELVASGPRTPFEAYLAEVWSDLLSGENLDVDDNFFERGGSSLQALMVMSRIREKLGLAVPTAAIFDSPTVAGLAGRLREAHPEVITQLFGAEVGTNGHNGFHDKESYGNGHYRNGHTNGNSPARTHTVSELLVALQPDGVGSPLFLIHPPGGIVACYQTLALQLGKGRPVYGVRARGLYGEERLPGTLEELAAEYVAAVRSIQPEGPYLLGGWSLGGVFAYEMAQQFQNAGEVVDLLALLDSTLPFGPMNSRYLEGIDQSGREFGLDLTLEELGAIGAEEQLPFLWNHAKALGLLGEGVPLDTAQQLIHDLKRVFHAHVSLVSEYTIAPYAGRITLFRPKGSAGAPSPPLDRGWSRLAEVEVRLVPGQHHTMVKEPHVDTLAEELNQSLREVARIAAIQNG